MLGKTVNKQHRFHDFLGTDSAFYAGLFSAKRILPGSNRGACFTEENGFKFVSPVRLR